MALSHLVDTSVLTRLRFAPVRDQIESRANVGELARAGISDLEIGYSARSAAEWDRLLAALSAARAQLGTETIKETVNQALRRAGQTRSKTVTAALDRLARADLGQRDDAWR
jgi:predicted nucleic acid-binding protein